MGAGLLVTLGQRGDWKGLEEEGRKATMMHGANGHLGVFWLKNRCCRIALLCSAGTGCTVGALCNAAC